MNDLAELCGGCVFLVFFVAILGGTIAVVVLDIIALKDTSNIDVHDKCSESALWPYVLVSLILTCSNLMFSSNSSANKNDKKQGITINTSIVSVAIFVWGCIELWGIDCVNNMSHTLLYKMALVHLISSIVSISIIVVCVFLVCCGACLGV